MDEGVGSFGYDDRGQGRRGGGRGGGRHVGWGRFLVISRQSGLNVTRGLVGSAGRRLDIATTRRTSCCGGHIDGKFHRIVASCLKLSAAKSLVVVGSIMPNSLLPVVHSNDVEASDRVPAQRLSKLPVKVGLSKTERGTTKNKNARQVLREEEPIGLDDEP